MQPDDETKQKMVDILKRFHSEEIESMDEDDDSTLSEETIQKILSGKEFSLDDLSLEEKKQFQRAMASGELGKLIMPWEAWWSKPSARRISLSRDGMQLVKPLPQQEATISPQDSAESDQLNEIPAGPETPLPPVNKLTSREPSPLVAFQLIDIMYSYCFALRLYNGDWQSDALGTAMVVLDLSNVLAEAGQPESVRGALAYCLEQTCSATYKHTGGLRFGLGLLDDTLTLLNLGGAAIVCFLCDLRRLVEAAEREIQSGRERNSKSRIKSKLKQASRKVYFMMCWVHEQPDETWTSLAALVETEKKSIAAMDQRDCRKLLLANSTEGKGKVLIKEIQ